MVFRYHAVPVCVQQEAQIVDPGLQVAPDVRVADFLPIFLAFEDIGGRGDAVVFPDGRIAPDKGLVCHDPEGLRGADEGIAGNAGGRLIGLAEAAVDDDQLAAALDGAFTRLCLTALEKLVKPGVRVLDLGCGSGILSIAACLLGAGRALGIDIDALAVKTAIENGELNGLTPPRYEIRLGDLAKDVSGKYPVIAANIVADAIIMLSPAIPALLADDGVYIVSGIIDTREQDVLAALDNCGFTVVERREHGGWICLVTKKA